MLISRTSVIPLSYINVIFTVLAFKIIHNIIYITSLKRNLKRLIVYLSVCRNNADVLCEGEAGAAEESGDEEEGGEE